MSGFIKVDRKLLNHWTGSEPESLAIWVRLLLEANFKSEKKLINGQLVNIQRGQLVFGIHAFSERTGISVAKIRRIIKNLENDDMISKQSFSKYSIVSITNYSSYQVTNKQETTKSQTNDKQTTTLEEGKELKEGKNIYIHRFDDFWKVYGKPVDKKQALDQWKRKVKTSDLADKIIQAASKYATTREKKYRKSPMRWLRDENWNDEIAPAQGNFLSERPEDFAGEATSGKGW